MKESYAIAVVTVWLYVTLKNMWKRKNKGKFVSEASKRFPIKRVYGKIENNTEPEWKMKVFAVSDLHLPGNQDKPMDVFGGNWTGHFEKIREDWKAKVRPEDIVLIAGDVSWAMVLSDALMDLEKMRDLSGKKIFIRGNHDFWWSGITALRASAPDETFYFLQNDGVRLENLVVCGSRGWTCPGGLDFKAEDEKIYLREGERFRLALQSADKLRQEGDRLIAMIHYPPFNIKKEDSLFTDLFEKYGVDTVVYGHLHQNAGAYPFEFMKNGIRYLLTSCDLLGFRLIEL